MIIITAGFFLAYSIIYPIGQWAIISYLHDNTLTIKQALRKGRKHFFAMFETSILSVIFHPMVLIIAAFQILTIKGNVTLTSIFWLAVWMVALNIINTLKAYIRYVIMIDQVPLYESLKTSAKLCLQNMNNNFKYMRVQTVLLFNFSFNLILIIWIPFLIIYGAISLNIIQYGIVKVIAYISFFVMVIFGSYVSAIIRAFFVYYWFEIYKISKKESK
jgi:hypothetical protein